MNLCCLTIFALTAAATGERQSFKKKKHRMMALRKPGGFIREKHVWTALPRVKGGIVLFLKSGALRVALAGWGSDVWVMHREVMHKE
jgi:hypothetical protein